MESGVPYARIVVVRALCSQHASVWNGGTSYWSTDLQVHPDVWESEIALEFLTADLAAGANLRKIGSFSILV